jgi:hypothetical protein
MMPPAAICGSVVTAETSVAPGRVVVHERPAVRAGLVALHAEPVRAALFRQRGLGGARHGDHHRAARVLERPDHPGRRAAEGEAGDRGRIGEQGRDLAVEPVVVPAGVAEPGAERVQVPGERSAVRVRRAGHEEVDAEGFGRRGPHGGDLGGHRLGRLVARGQPAEGPGPRGRHHELGRGRAAGHRRHHDPAPQQVRQGIPGR